MSTDRLLQVISGPTTGLLVFAFPPSASGPALFRRWLPFRPPGLELVAIHTPGRESRFAEPPVSSLTPLADDIAAAIDAYAERPYVIFGHSVGATLGREVAMRLRRRSRPLSMLVAAGSAAPDILGDTTLADADDQTLIGALREWGVTPDDMVDEDVADVILPVMRADMAVDRACRLGRPPTAEDRLDIPIVAITGDDDPMAEINYRSWAAWTDAAHSAHVVPGGHSVPFEQPAAVLEILVREAGRLGGPRLTVG
ncbi:thioesterase [Streptomyces sp. uw30]|uniref:thioesterase II family protein n=1 Tax=Streptomyces sp. uw30 TaxID=1828179 RepID=UPI0011CEB0C9|nr:alpha/beta fold hydrolase [Streptomyces sp. uw30]TXS45075.1 thioesterase [Streptomyces sp. uw30]